MCASHPPGDARVGRLRRADDRRGSMGHDTEADGVRMIREIRHGIAP
jgi:hypothetical protein